MRCQDCCHLKCYKGSTDWYGVPQEPDDYECTGNPSEEDLERYFCNDEEWHDDEDECSGFEWKGDGIDE